MPGLTSKQAMKRLIMCVDGTGADAFGHSNKAPSNIYRIYKNLAKTATIRNASGGSIEIEQRKQYQSGVGTKGMWATRLYNSVNAGEIVHDVYLAYKWLFENYQQGDEVFMFGFSRGAFTVRSLAGHISQRGIKVQTEDDFEDDYEKSQKGKSTTNERDPDLKIKAIGVFDTVGSLGAPKFQVGEFDVSFTSDQYLFHNTALSPIVENAFQALGLDERRVPFQPMLWENPENLDVNLKQTWFSGAHTNVGGGYEYTEVSDITLAWMLDQLGDLLAFDETSIRAMFEENRNRSRTVCPGGIHSVWGNGHIVDSTEMLKDAVISGVEGVKNFFGTGGDWLKTATSKLAKGAEHRLPDTLAQRLHHTAESLDDTEYLELGPPKLVKHLERHPGAYMRMNPLNGSDTQEALQNTNELMHPSVRVRLIGQGPKIEDEPGHYDSHSFGSFERPPRNEGAGWRWKFKPDLTRPEERGLVVNPLLEDVLGPKQKMLLDMFQDSEPKEIEVKQLGEKAWMVL